MFPLLLRADILMASEDAYIARKKPKVFYFDFLFWVHRLITVVSELCRYRLKSILITN